jgi:hypothetical protein
MSKKKEYDNFIKSLYLINKNPKYIDDYIIKFGEEPNIIGMFWNQPTILQKNIENAIKTDKKYNELDLLTDEQRKSFLKGDILF